MQQTSFNRHSSISPPLSDDEMMLSQLSHLSMQSRLNDSPDFIQINPRISLQDPYRDFLYTHSTQRRRLSSTGEGSGDSSTTTSGESSYGERDEGSEGRTESEEASTSDRDYREDRKPLEGQITCDERQQVESFFKGLKTEVYVSSSLANLYMKVHDDKEWSLRHCGIPVIILDIGESRARNKRKIQIVLAERGTGFSLWSDTIDNLSSYQVSAKAFHTMCYSGDHTLKIGFSFDTEAAAAEMWSHVEQLVACPENISLSVPGKKKKKNKEKKKVKPAPLPSKNNISTPCCFQHVTSVDVEDSKRFMSLKEYLPQIQRTRIHELKDI